MKAANQNPNQRGFVLSVVLGMVLAIMVLVLNLNRKARASLKISDATRNTSQAWATAQAGLQTAIHALRFVGDVTVDSRTRSWLTTPQNIPVTEGHCTLSLTDESGKININRLKHPDGRLDRARIEQLLRLIDCLNRQNPSAPAIRYGLVPALIDWTDNDTEVTVLPFIHKDNRGDESTAHGPAGCANRPLVDLSELHLVKGFTPEITSRLTPFLTLYGDGQINLNSASAEVITALSERMDLTLARLIVKRRGQSPFTSQEDLQRIPGITPALLHDLQQFGVIGQSGPYYRVQATGQVHTQILNVEALLIKNPEAQSVDVIKYREWAQRSSPSDSLQ